MAMIKCKECGNEISSKAEACPKCGAKPKKASILLKIILGFIVLSALSSIFKGKSASSASNGQTNSQVKAITQKSDVGFNVSFEKAGFDNIAMLHGSITNSGPTDVKDIQIECEGYAASGTKIDTNKRTLYELVGAGKTINFEKFNMGFINIQVKSTQCAIIGFTPA